LGLFLFLWAVRGERKYLRRESLFFAGLKDRRYAPLLVGTALFGTVIPNVLQNIGMKMMDPSSTSSLASLIQGVSPIFTILLAWMVLKERLTTWKVVGLALAIPATIVLTTYSQSGMDLGSEETVGALLNLLTALCYSLSGLFLKSALNKGAKPIPIIAVNSFLGTILLFPVTLVFWALGTEDPLVSLDAGPAALLSMVYLSVCIYAITAMVWYRVIRSDDLSRITFYVFLLPLFSYVFGYIMLGDRLSTVQVASGAVLLLAVYLAQLRGNPLRGQRPTRPHEE
jgi:drug/metabolite transporter (DMT)-like permease